MFPYGNNFIIHLLGHGKRSFAGANIVMYYTPTSVGLRRITTLHDGLFLSIKIKPLRFNHVATIIIITIIIFYLAHSYKLYERLLSADTSV